MIKNIIGIIFWSFALFIYMCCVANIVGCVVPDPNYEPTPPRTKSAMEIEGNLIEIDYVGHEHTTIILFFEDGRELMLTSTRENSWTYPLKKGYVRIKHNYGRVTGVYEKNEEGEWKEVR